MSSASGIRLGQHIHHGMDSGSVGCVRKTEYNAEISTFFY